MFAISFSNDFLIDFCIWFMRWIKTTEIEPSSKRFKIMSKTLIVLNEKINERVSKKCYSNLCSLNYGCFLS